MRELIEKDKRITVVPHDFKNANKGTIVEVSPKQFIVELDYEPEGIMRHNYCEFYTQTTHGTLYFDSYPESVEGKRITIANPAKHRFLQRRQYTRVKFINDLDLNSQDHSHKITTLDISAGGMRFKTKENINIEGEFTINIPLSSEQNVQCIFSPIRIEKNNEGGFTLSGRFNYHNSKDKMTLTQYCAKRSIEIKNK
ncbi:MAG: PilZ domain-containing protein [Candidatus Gastranaerophilaceae bacterium]